MLGTLLIGINIVALFAFLPAWPYSARWGYCPTWVTGALLTMLIGLALGGVI
ncbi:DUF3309 family protein [Methylophilus flavus]|uniref:DUF3309 family protein n=1 Tax=Methylophilus flavus TaxID=640084 RepID=A0ABW3PHQ9_9PROT